MSDEYTYNTGVTTEAGAVAAIVGERVVTNDLNDDVLLVVRPGSTVQELVDLDRFRELPRQKAGSIHVHTPDGLVTYAKRHVEPTLSTLWADVDAATITVVCNDHSSEDAELTGWADHRVALRLRHSPEWKDWTDLDGKDLSQTALAEFLEERIGDILEPDGATLLEVAQTLHATTGARFKSAVALHSGEQQLVWEETVAATAGTTGKAEIPRQFTVSLAPFYGTDKQPVVGRFRFRVREGRLTLGFRLLHLTEILQAAVEEVAKTAAGELGLDVINGTAPAARR